MNKPKVSIITPAFKCKKTINETYESIKNQTFSSWEWLVIEDCSNDGTYELIEEMVKDDERVVLLKTEKNSGASVARNIGIEHSKGRYIAFLDADDLFKEDKLEKQIAFMEKNGYEFTFTNYDLLYKNGTIKHRRIASKSINFKKLLTCNYIGCLTAIYDSEILGKVFMPNDCEKREDHAAWLDITKKGIIAYKLDESLSIYRVENGSVSSNKFKMIKYQYRLYRKHLNFGAIKSLYLVLVCSMKKVFRKY